MGSRIVLAAPNHKGVSIVVCSKNKKMQRRERYNERRFLIVFLVFSLSHSGLIREPPLPKKRWAAREQLQRRI